MLTLIMMRFIDLFNVENVEIWIYEDVKTE
jgi:hypothetical protein